MRRKHDSVFSDTKGMNVGDVVGFDPSKEGTGGYEEDTIAKLYPFSLVLESGRAIGVARVTMHRPPSTTRQTIPPQSTILGKPKEKPWFIRSDEDDEAPKPYVSFPF